jgi:AmiR/NasT family two-component response regulator
LFGTEPGELRAGDCAAAQALADVATIAIIQHRAVTRAQELNGQLNHALNSRVLVEQAKGMLAAQANLDMDQAFSRLRNHARNHNVLLVSVARDFVDGTLTMGALGLAASR